MNINPIVLSIPVFFILIGIELLVERFTHQKLYRLFKWPKLGLIILILCSGCGKPLPTLEGIDLRRWQEDKHACSNIRGTMRDALDGEKEKLLSLTQMQIVELLGKPDENELYSRNQKFFYYYLDPAPSCANVRDSTAERLVIRFNAVGLAKQVSVE